MPDVNLRIEHGTHQDILNELETGTLQFFPFAPKMSFTHSLITHKNREYSHTAKGFESALLD
ncbi:hypothetical protein [Paenibacillus sp. Root52]|uniref:hypothetical protein n=1 Tax=Paenibacillus sp. Root52 TaxID=1736552 RepID=UPI000AF273E9|nr:hypothetical protein [Paenibacillus sp. Root52]